MSWPKQYVARAGELPAKAPGWAVSLCGMQCMATCSAAGERAQALRGAAQARTASLPCPQQRAVQRKQACMHAAAGPWTTVLFSRTFLAILPTTAVTKYWKGVIFGEIPHRKEPCCGPCLTTTPEAWPYFTLAPPHRGPVARHACCLGTNRWRAQTGAEEQVPTSFIALARRGCEPASTTFLLMASSRGSTLALATGSPAGTTSSCRAAAASGLQAGAACGQGAQLQPSCTEAGCSCRAGSVHGLPAGVAEARWMPASWQHGPPQTPPAA
jgi:hypothetical protein